MQHSLQVSIHEGKELHKECFQRDRVTRAKLEAFFTPHDDRCLGLLDAIHETRGAPVVQHRKHSLGCIGIKGLCNERFFLLGTRTFFYREQEFPFYA